MICGYLQQLTLFKAFADKDSSQIKPFKGEAHFSGTTAGLPVGQGHVINQTVSSPTHMASERAPTMQKNISSHQVQQDLIHRVRKRCSHNHQALDQHKTIHATDKRVVKRSRVKPVTPIKITCFAKWIRGFKFEDYLMTGLQEGFKIGYEGPRNFRDCTNLKPCREYPQVMSEKIATELALDRIQGPFDQTPFPNIQDSPIGIVPKKKPGEFRLIPYLSYPEGNSVNNFIYDELSTGKYSTFDDAVAMVLFLGPGCHLCKTDIKSA